MDEFGSKEGAVHKPVYSTSAKGQHVFDVYDAKEAQIMQG